MKKDYFAGQYKYFLWALVLYYYYLVLHENNSLNVCIIFLRFFSYMNIYYSWLMYFFKGKWLDNYFGGQDINFFKVWQLAFYIALLISWSFGRSERGKDEGCTKYISIRFNGYFRFNLFSLIFKKNCTCNNRYIYLI